MTFNGAAAQIVVNGTLLAIALWLFRRWMNLIEGKFVSMSNKFSAMGGKLDDAIKRFDHCQTEERCESFRRKMHLDCRDHRAQFMTDITKLEAHNQQLAIEVKDRVAWEYCRNCDKRKPG